MRGKSFSAAAALAALVLAGSPAIAEWVCIPIQATHQPAKKLWHGHRQTRQIQTHHPWHRAPHHKKRPHRGLKTRFCHRYLVSTICKWVWVEDDTGGGAGGGGGGYEGGSFGGSATDAGPYSFGAVSGGGGGGGGAVMPPFAWLIPQLPTSPASDVQTPDSPIVPDVPDVTACADTSCLPDVPIVPVVPVGPTIPTANTPEASTWAMMLMGFLAIGALSVSRRRTGASDKS